MGTQAISLASRDTWRPRRFFRTYGEFARVGFVNTLAYRLRYYTGIVTYFIYVTVYYFIWKAIYEHSSQIEGFDFSHILTYIAVGWIIRSFYFNNVDQDMANQVIEGKLAMDLIKPVNIQFMYVAQAFGECLVSRRDAEPAHGVGAHADLPLAPARQPAPLPGLPRQRGAQLLHRGRHQFRGRDAGGQVEIHSGSAARQVFSAGTLLRPAFADFLLSRKSFKSFSSSCRSSTSATSRCCFTWGKSTAGEFWARLPCNFFGWSCSSPSAMRMWRWSSRKITIQGG